jgi:hypothetical protein
LGTYSPKRPTIDTSTSFSVDSCRQSGDDSKLADVWEEFKYQVQREGSAAFELYEDLIRDIGARPIRVLDPEQQQLLWLWSNGFSSSWVDKDVVSIDDFEHGPVATELYDRVCAVASDEELAIDPDAERDQERYTDDKDSD